MFAMARSMARSDFRSQQEERRLDPHIAPINELVDRLRDRDGRGWLPEVAPLHGGVHARLLSILRDPGPATQAGTGSGFLCVENDDPTAERQAELFKDYGIEVSDVLPWNAYPWYINRAPNAAELDAGAEVLCELIPMLTALRVVLLQGAHAADAWKRACKRQPALAQIPSVESIHPGRQALWTPDPKVREARLQKQRDAYTKVAAILNA